MLLVRQSGLRDHDLVGRLDLRPGEAFLGQLLQRRAAIDQHDGASQDDAAHKNGIVLDRLGDGRRVGKAAGLKHQRPDRARR